MRRLGCRRSANCPPSRCIGCLAERLTCRCCWKSLRRRSAAAFSCLAVLSTSSSMARSSVNSCTRQTQGKTGQTAQPDSLSDSAAAAAGWSGQELTSRQLLLSFLRLLCGVIGLLLRFFGGHSSDGGRSGQRRGLLLGRRRAELSRVGCNADALMRSQMRNTVDLLVVLLAIIDAAVVAVHLGRSSRLCGVAVLAGQSGQLGHRVAVRLHLHHLDHAEVLWKLERRVQLQRWVETAAQRALEQSNGSSGRGRRRRNQ